MSTWVTQQHAVLRTLVKSHAKTSLFSHLGMSKLGAYKDFDLLYQAFVRATPVQSPRAWMESVTKITSPTATSSNTSSMLAALSSANLLARGKPLAASFFRGVPLPVGTPAVADHLHAEATLKTHLQKAGIPLAGTFFYLTDVEPTQRGNAVPLLPWMTVVDERRSWFRKRWTAPRFATLPAVGGRRLEWFGAMYDALKVHGKDVSVLIAHPKTLLDFGLYVSQQEGLFVPLATWCPNLKVYLYNSYDVALQRTELSYLFAGLPDLKWAQWLSTPTGLQAWQADINIRQRLELLTHGSTFYEFVPLSDIEPDGKFVRNFKRLHAGQITAGQEYLVIQSTLSGLLAVSSGQVFKILGLEPLRLAARGPVVKLNGLLENFREDGVVEALANINMALSGHGVFVRDALLGHHILDRQPKWVVEVSRPLPEVPQMLLESIAKRLQSELELRSESYRQNCQRLNIKMPILHVVPMGSFAAAALNMPELGHFDLSPDAAGVTRILGAAWQSQTLQVK